jgi:hypothetical protein
MRDHLAGSLKVASGRSSLMRVVAERWQVACPCEDELRPVKDCVGCPRFVGWCLSTGAGQLALVCRLEVRP